MVSGTLNNSNFYSFKSYWIFGILGIFIKFQTSKPYWTFETLIKVSKFQTSVLSNIQIFKLPKRVGSLKLWSKFQSFKVPYFQISKLSNFQNVLEV